MSFEVCHCVQTECIENKKEKKRKFCEEGEKKNKITQTNKSKNCLHVNQKLSTDKKIP